MDGLKLSPMARWIRGLGAGVAILFFGCVSRAARASPPVSPHDPEPRPRPHGEPVPKWHAPPRPLELFMVSYFTSVAVSLSADRGCVGSTCNERYYSLVPVAGGALQFGFGGLEFHEHHHGSGCLPLTLGGMAGQALGLVTLGLFPSETGGDSRQLTLLERVRVGMSTYQGGTGVGVGIGFYD